MGTSPTNLPPRQPAAATPAGKQTASNQSVHPLRAGSSVILVILVGVSETAGEKQRCSNAATGGLAGADKTSINSAAVRRPELITEGAKRFGSQCIVVAIDAKRVSQDGEPDRWEIFTDGGRKPTGPEAVEWAKKMADYGAGEILLTSMDRDGTRIGFDNALTRAIAEAIPIPIIASGGVGNLDHLVEGVIEGGADAVLAASIFHFAEYTIGQAKQHMQEAGIEVRL